MRKGLLNATGWAENASQTNSALTVDFDADGANAPALSAGPNQFRQDLLNAGIGTGYYAFNLVTPAALAGWQHPDCLRALGADGMLTLALNFLSGLSERRTSPGDKGG